MAVLWSSSPVSRSATLLGLWTFDGTAGSNVGTVSNLANPGVVNMTASKSGSNVYPVYGSAVPGLQLYNPLTSTYYSLGSSMGVSIYGQGATTGATTGLDSTNGFTLQLSLNLASTAGKGNTIISRSSGSTTGWRILSNASGKIYVQFFSNGLTSTLWSSGTNYYDDAWHTLALTFDGTSNLARLLIDGVANSVTLTAGSVASDIDSNGLALTLGTTVGTGTGTSYFSSLSYTDSVLANNQLMTIVPEPTIISCVLLGLVVMLIPRWRRRLAFTGSAD